MAVDHCFSIRGQGTVMTGTILQGSLAVNDTVEIPALKVRSRNYTFVTVTWTQWADRQADRQRGRQTGGQAEGQMAEWVQCQRMFNFNVSEGWGGGW